MTEEMENPVALAGADRVVESNVLLTIAKMKATGNQHAVQVRLVAIKFRLARQVPASVSRPVYIGGNENE